MKQTIKLVEKELRKIDSKIGRARDNARRCFESPIKFHYDTEYDLWNTKAKLLKNKKTILNTELDILYRRFKTTKEN